MPRFDITFAGELNLDLIFYGLPEEMPREHEVLANDMMLTLGGSSSIVAHNLAALGSRVGFVAKIGEDQLGQIALDRLAESGADVSKMIRVKNLKTGLTVILQRTDWRNMVTYSGTIAELRFEDLDFAYLTDAKHFHLSSFYLQTALQPRVADLFKKLKAAGLTISLDTNDDPAGKWQGLEHVLPQADVFMPNEWEACGVAGTDDLEKAVAHLAAIVPLVVVKMGRKGAMAQRGKQRITSPPLQVNAVDAVGAGDSFNSGFLSQYVKGVDLETCLAAGNRAGALSTTKPGGTEAFRDREHREKFLRENKIHPLTGH
jgi:sugar/nucleoside kinase (ribokinase family)